MRAVASALENAPWTLWVMLALALFGLVVLASASAPISEARYGNPQYLVQTRLQYLGLGLLVMAAVLGVPLHWWQRLDWPLLLGVVVLLVLTLLTGEVVKGSARWLQIGSFSGQPSEIAKFALPVYIAGYCSRRAQQGQLGWTRGFTPLVVAGFLIGLIFWQPDFGTSVLLFSVALAVLFVAGMRLLQLLFLILGGVTLGWLLIAGNSYRMQRWQAFVDPFSDPWGSGWQLIQSMIAFTRGGFFGTGLGESAQKHFVLPEVHNDFVLAVIAEEAGFFAVALVLLGFCAIAFRAFRIAADFLRDGDDFAGYLVLGLGLMLMGQVLFNVGAATGMLPPKGISLPMFSAGGSNLLVTAVCFAVLLRAEAEWSWAQKPGGHR